MRKFSFVLPAFIMIIVTIACSCMYMYFTDKLPTIRKKNENMQAMTQNTDGIVLSANEMPKLDAAMNLQPLVKAILSDFTKSNNISDSFFEFSDTDEGYRKLVNGDIDILFATEPSEDTLTLAKAQGIEFDMIPIAKEGFVFFVNPLNPMDSLKTSDIQKIYIGQATNWSQIGGANVDIKPFQRVDKSLNQRAMTSLVMKNLPMVAPLKDIFYDKTFGEINDLIASYDNSEGAIGYSYYSEAKIMYDTDNSTDNAVKILKINDVEPNYDNIHNGSYILQTNYYLIKNKNNNYENVQIFIDNMLSERGKKIVKEAGYIDT